jgi:hypothetical protein
VLKINLGPRRFETFRNNKNFYGEGLLEPRPTPKLEDHPLSAVCYCLLDIFAAIFLIWRSSLHLQPEDALCHGDKGLLIQYIRSYLPPLNAVCSILTQWTHHAVVIMTQLTWTNTTTTTMLHIQETGVISIFTNTQESIITHETES